jgi:UDP-GlcNAc3NAcA epimerase
LSRKIKIITIVGARPQFIKAAAVSRAIANTFSAQIEEKIIHTGQHFDDNMSKVFFHELSIPQPHYHFSISGGTHGVMTGKMLASIEEVLLSEKPDWILIYGDTNSTLAGALAAAKLHIPVAHVEAGLRSYNMRMPEEINRIVSDRVSQLLFCPTQTSVDNLKSEGILTGVHNVGDVMYDVALFYQDRARQNSKIISQLNLAPREFGLATCHRAENTDNPKRLEEILTSLNSIAERMPVVLPLHPRTRKITQNSGLDALLTKLVVTDPLPFLDMVALEQQARIILTDSGGVQKEAFFYGIPCITMRDETEWVETVESGWNRLAPPLSGKILESTLDALSALPSTKPEPYGNGDAATLIVEKILAARYGGFKTEAQQRPQWMEVEG